MKGEDNSASFLISNKGLCVNVSYSELGDGQVMWTGDVLCTLKVILAQRFRIERDLILALYLGTDQRFS